MKSFMHIYFRNLCVLLAIYTILSQIPLLGPDCLKTDTIYDAFHGCGTQLCRMVHFCLNLT